MQTCLPKFIAPLKLAAAGGRLEGELPLAAMRRLASLLSTSQGSVAVALTGGIDEQGILFIAGHLETVVQMTCQRCMESMRVPLSVDFRLGLVQSESQCNSLPRAYEPLLVSEGDIVLSELVEDELILVLPIVPRHEDVSCCEAAGFVLPRLQEDPRAWAEQANPFASLSELLKNSKD